MYIRLSYIDQMSDVSIIDYFVWSNDALLLVWLINLSTNQIRDAIFNQFDFAWLSAKIGQVVRAYPSSIHNTYYIYIGIVHMLERRDYYSKNLLILNI